MDTSPKRERHPAEVQSRRSTSPTDPSQPRHHGWWNGIYNPHSSSVQEVHERFHHEEPIQTQKPSMPRESRDIINEVDTEEWARYRRKKSFLTELGGW